MRLPEFVAPDCSSSSNAYHRLDEMTESALVAIDDDVPVVSDGPVLVDRMTVGGLLTDHHHHHHREHTTPATVSFLPAAPFLQPASAYLTSLFDPYSTYLSMPAVLPTMYQQAAAATQAALAAAAAAVYMPQPAPPTLAHPCPMTSRMCHQCAYSPYCSLHHHRPPTTFHHYSSSPADFVPPNVSIGQSTSAITASGVGAQGQAVRVKRPAPSTIDFSDNDGSKRQRCDFMQPCNERDCNGATTNEQSDEEIRESIIAASLTATSTFPCGTSAASTSTTNAHCVCHHHSLVPPPPPHHPQLPCVPCSCQPHYHYHHAHHPTCASCDAGITSATQSATIQHQQAPAAMSFPSSMMYQQSTQQSTAAPPRTRIIPLRRFDIAGGSSGLVASGAPTTTMIHPTHEHTLNARAIAAERERAARTLWFHQRQQQHAQAAAAAAAAVGGLVSVEMRRVQQPLVMVPRLPMMELSMFVLQPTNDAFLNASAAAAAAAAEPQPIGASADMIQQCSCTLIFGERPEPTQDEPERCTVCLMDFEAGEELRRLHCLHRFHTACIDRWLVYNKKCPVCRLDLDTPLHHHHHHQASSSSSLTSSSYA